MGTCCAVNSLQLNLYENQILALLGIHIHFMSTYDMFYEKIGSFDLYLH